PHRRAVWRGMARRGWEVVRRRGGSRRGDPSTCLSSRLTSGKAPRFKHPSALPGTRLDRSTAQGHVSGLGAGVDTEALRNAPIRSEFEKVWANHSRKVMVEGKGFDTPPPSY